MKKKLEGLLVLVNKFADLKKMEDRTYYFTQKPKGSVYVDILKYAMVPDGHRAL